MKTMKSDPQAVYFSTMLYNLLLITYPKDFKRVYASSMAQVFRDCCLRSFQTSGFPGMFCLWRDTLIDYIKSMLAEYTLKGALMNTSRFIRLSGWSLVLGITMYLTSVIAVWLISDRSVSSDPNNFYSRPIDLILATLPYILIPVAMLLLTIGLAGVRQLYGPRASALGNAGLIAGITGSGLALVTSFIPGGWYGLIIFLVYNQVGGWWLWNLGALAPFVLFGGIFIFGIDAVKRRLLLRRSFIPILAGTLFPLRILVGFLQETTTKGWSRWGVDITLINLPMLIITFFGLIVLGSMLISGAPQEEQLVMGQPGAMG